MSRKTEAGLKTVGKGRCGAGGCGPWAERVAGEVSTLPFHTWCPHTSHLRMSDFATTEGQSVLRVDAVLVAMIPVHSCFSAHHLPIPEHHSMPFPFSPPPPHTRDAFCFEAVELPSKTLHPTPSMFSCFTEDEGWWWGGLFVLLCRITSSELKGILCCCRRMYL